MSRMPRLSVSTTSSIADDEDAITPCPLAPPPADDVDEPVSPTSPQPAGAPAGDMRSPSPSWSQCGIPHTDMATASSSRRSSVQIIESGTEGDPERLWKRMLALQQIYGCYKSARMAAALEMGDAERFAPSKACLDLLNEHMELLPEDADQRLHNWFDGLWSRTTGGKRQRSRSQ